MAADSQRDFRTPPKAPATARPVIVLTALQDDTEEKTLDPGSQDCLAKVVQSRLLVARTPAVLERATS
jgi:DNA-binding response OmpR family regulator